MEKELYREMYEMELSHWWFRGKRRIVLHLIDRYLASNTNPDFLDLGCGTGAMLADLERRGKVAGVDSSHDAITFAAGHTGARLVEADIGKEMPELDGSFDCITMLDLLEHLEDDQGAVIAAAELLAPRGFIVITVPAYQSLYAPRDEYHHHLRRYSRVDLAQLIDNADLEALVLSYYNTLLFLPAAISRVLSRIRHEETGPDLSLPPRPVNAALEQIFAVERLVLPRVAMPFGLSLISVVRRRNQEAT